MHQQPRTRKDQGFTLIIGLVFLLLIAILGLASMQSALLDERAANSENERTIAFQAAEMAIRDAERDLKGTDKDGNECVTNCRPLDKQPPGPGNAGNTLLMAFQGTCDTGQCYFPTAKDFQPDGKSFTTPTPSVTDETPFIFWRDTNLQKDDAAGANAKATRYGRYTGAAAIPGVSKQPIYWFETIPNQSGTRTPYFYRITAMGFGKNANTVVVLQSIMDPSGADN